MPRIPSGALPLSSPLGAALEHLEASERDLAQQLDATRIALSSLRVVHRPPPTIPLAPVETPRQVKSLKVAPSRKAPAPPIAQGSPAGRILRAVAKHGPDVRFATILAEVDLADIHARYHVKKLVRDGRLVGKGTTGSRRYSLPGSSAGAAPSADGKEEP